MPLHSVLSQSSQPLGHPAVFTVRVCRLSLDSSSDWEGQLLSLGLSLALAGPGWVLLGLTGALLLLSSLLLASSIPAWLEKDSV